MVVRVEVAGPLGLAADERAISVARLGRHDRLAFAYLTLERTRQVSREELAELVWEARLPPSWKPALRGIVSRVRATLAQAELSTCALGTGPGWCELTLPPDTIVDVEAAEKALGSAVDLLAAGDADGARAAAVSALSVARKPFLIGVHAAWVDQRQELLDDLRLRTHEVLADAALHADDWAEARRAAEQAVVLAPLRESVYRRLALAHTGLGDRGEALRVLARCRQRLAEELGAGVSPETEALSIELLRGTPLSALTARLGHDGRRASTGREATSTGKHRVPLERFVDRSTPFVGRTSESAQLRQAWRRAAGGEPEVVVLVGEAGAGKTRLIAEFADSLGGSGTTVLLGQGDEHGPVGPQALIDALREHVNGSVPTALGPAALAELVRTTLCRIASQTTVLFVLDDLQWLGRDTITVLRHVLRSVDPLPLLVAGTYRTGEPVMAERLPSLLRPLHSLGRVTQISVAGLPRPEVAQLVRACGGLPPDAATAAAITDATAGNPLFVRELTRLLGDEGRFGSAYGTITLDRDTKLGVPESLRQAILARCRHLSPMARRVLAAAAVCGREFELSVLEAMTALSTVDVLARVEESLVSELIVERPAMAGRFAFVHGLVQETLYQDLSTVRRQRLHADVAAVLEALPGTTTGGPPHVAYHLLRGGRSVAERAAEAAARAGADALRRHAYDEAARHYAAALEVAGPQASVRCRLRLELAGARWRAGEIETARLEYEAAADEAYRSNRGDLAARAVFGATGHGATVGRCDQRCVVQLTEALRVLDRGHPFRPRLLARLGAELAGAADPRAVELCEEALEIAEKADDQSTVAYVLNCQNWVNLGIAADQSGLARADRMIVLADIVGDRHMRLEGLAWRCTYLLRSGRLREASGAAAALAELAAELRQPFYQRLPLRVRATLSLVSGRLGESECLAAEAYAIERRVHPDDAEEHALLHGAAVSHVSGRWSRPDDIHRGEPDSGSPHRTAIRAVRLAAFGEVGPAARLLRPLLTDGAAALRRSQLAAFAAALIVRACEVDSGLRARVDADAAHAVLLPWRGTHIVAGCAVASLGFVDAHHVESPLKPTEQIKL